MQEKFAISLAITKPSGEIFFVRRPSWAPEFPLFMSLPTKTLSESEFTAISVNTEMTIPHFGVKGKCVDIDFRHRQDYLLRMALFICDYEQEFMDRLLAVYYRVD